jgi:hypothetical protein
MDTGEATETETEVCVGRERAESGGWLAGPRGLWLGADAALVPALGRTLWLGGRRSTAGEARSG